MTVVTAEAVKKLRELTDAPMMDCKKALTTAEGDFEKAQKLLREWGGAKADKKADREALEGQVGIALSQDGQAAAIVEINSETDFVARSDHFKTFLDEALATILKEQSASAEALSQAVSAQQGPLTIEQRRSEMVSRLGENIRVRRAQYFKAPGHLGYYVHLNKIGVVVCLQGGDSALAKEIAVHIAARNPQYIQVSEVPAAQVESERQLALAALKDSNKPQDIQNKIVDNKIKEYLKEMVLMEQPYLKDESKSVSQFLASNKAELVSFVRFQLGQGS